MTRSVKWRQWADRTGQTILIVGLLGMVGSQFIESQFKAPMAVASVLLVVVGYVSSMATNPRGYSERDLARSGTERDAEQRKWSFGVMLIGLCALPACVLSSVALWSFANGVDEADRFAMVFGPLVTASAFQAVSQGLRNGQYARKWLHDELMRSYQLSAMGWGFVTAFVGLVVIFGLMLWQAPVAVAAMPLVMGLSVAVAGTRLWWQVRGGEGG